MKACGLHWYGTWYVQIHNPQSLATDLRVPVCVCVCVYIGAYTFHTGGVHWGLVIWEKIEGFISCGLRGLTLACWAPCVLCLWQWWSIWFTTAIKGVSSSASWVIIYQQLPCSPSCSPIGVKFQMVLRSCLSEQSGSYRASLAPSGCPASTYIVSVLSAINLRSTTVLWGMS